MSIPAIREKLLKVAEECAEDGISSDHFAAACLCHAQCALEVAHGPGFAIKVMNELNNEWIRRMKDAHGQTQH